MNIKEVLLKVGLAVAGLAVGKAVSVLIRQQGVKIA
jgi:hypothetical protein